MAAFLQSQRRRLRGYLGQPWAQRGIETFSEASERSGGTKFCSKCQAISANIEEAINQGLRRACREKQRVTEYGALKHVLDKSQRKRCSLCNFLARMVEAYGVGLWWTASELSLFIGSAKSDYGIPPDFPQISESYFLWIWPSTRKGLISGPLLPYYLDDKYGSSGMALELSNDSGKISGRFVAPQTDFELVRSWFDDCATHHGNICQNDASVLEEIPGFRVIDCSSRTLVHWSQIPRSQDRDYVALSYVWGTEPDNENKGKAFWPNSFKKAGLEARGPKTMETPNASSDWTANGQLPSKLPLLIEDAITAVIKLCFRYLWVDRYCIPQENQEERHSQIHNMDIIYGSASLTIIAAAGNDPSYGLPGVSPRSGRFQKNLSTSVRIGCRTFVTVGTADAPETLKNSKWNTRAWTMQEAFLSCRCLVFLESGAYFQCSSPRSHRFESIHEPPALLNLKSESSSQIHDSIILTKGGRRVGYFEFGWCLQVVTEYFPRNMTFEEDSLNAFSGMLKYLQSFSTPVHNLWGVLMFPNFTSTASGQRITYNLVCGLAWVYKRDQRFIQSHFGKFRQPTILPRKGIFPSWSWVDWRSKTALDGQNFTSNHELGLSYQDSTFTCLVDLSVELHNGRIISWGQGLEWDVSRLTKLSQPPRILHVHGYTSQPQLRYITEREWGELCDRTFVDTKQDPDDDDCKSGGHLLGCNRGHKWVLIDADGKHLQQPFETDQLRKPWCWARRWDFRSRNLSIDTYHLQLQRESRAVADIETFHSSTFNFRVILLGYNSLKVYYMVLTKLPATDSHTETFERVNVLQESWPTEPARMKEFVAKLAGKHTKSCPGTPWMKMNTRIA